MSRGEVWWADHPVASRRPGLILTRDEAIEHLSEILIVPATWAVRDIPTHVQLDEIDGMREPCSLALENVGPISKGFLIERLTALGPEKMAEVYAALAAATAC